MSLIKLLITQFFTFIYTRLLLSVEESLIEGFQKIIKGSCTLVQARTHVFSHLMGFSSRQGIITDAVSWTRPHNNPNAPNDYNSKSCNNKFHLQCVDFERCSFGLAQFEKWQTCKQVNCEIKTHKRIQLKLAGRNERF